MKQLILIGLLLGSMIPGLHAEGPPTPPRPPEAKEQPKEASKVSTGERIEIPDVGFSIVPPNGWMVHKNSHGSSLLFEAPKQPNQIYQPTLQVMVFSKLRYIDEVTMKEYGDLIVEKFGKMSNRVTGYRLRDAAIQRLETGDPSILYYTEFQYDDVQIMQMHILISSATNHFVMTYTDVARVFEDESSPGLAIAYTSMHSAQLDSRPPWRWRGFAIGGIVAFLVIMGWFTLRFMRARRMTRLGQRIEEEDNKEITQDEDSHHYSRHSPATQAESHVGDEWASGKPQSKSGMKVSQVQSSHFDEDDEPEVSEVVPISTLEKSLHPGRKRRQETVATAPRHQTPPVSQHQPMSQHPISNHQPVSNHQPMPPGYAQQPMPPQGMPQHGMQTPQQAMQHPGMQVPQQPIQTAQQSMPHSGMQTAQQPMQQPGMQVPQQPMHPGMQTAQQPMQQPGMQAPQQPMHPGMQTAQHPGMHAAQQALQQPGMQAPQQPMHPGMQMAQQPTQHLGMQTPQEPMHPGMQSTQHPAQHPGMQVPQYPTQPGMQPTSSAMPHAQNPLPNHGMPHSQQTVSPQAGSQQGMGHPQMPKQGSQQQRAQAVMPNPGMAVPTPMPQYDGHNAQPMMPPTASPSAQPAMSQHGGSPSPYGNPQTGYPHAAPYPQDMAQAQQPVSQHPIQPPMTQQHAAPMPPPAMQQPAPFASPAPMPIAPQFAQEPVSHADFMPNIQPQSQPPVSEQPAYVHQAYAPAAQAYAAPAAAPAPVAQAFAPPAPAAAPAMPQFAPAVDPVSEPPITTSRATQNQLNRKQPLSQNLDDEPEMTEEARLSEILPKAGTIEKSKPKRKGLFWRKKTDDDEDQDETSEDKAGWNVPASKKSQSKDDDEDQDDKADWDVPASKKSQGKDDDEDVDAGEDWAVAPDKDTDTAMTEKDDDEPAESEKWAPEATKRSDPKKDSLLNETQGPQRLIRRTPQGPVTKERNNASVTEDGWNLNQDVASDPDEEDDEEVG